MLGPTGPTVSYLNLPDEGVFIQTMKFLSLLLARQREDFFESCRATRSDKNVIVRVKRS
jgi:hypothetical protein